MGRGKANQLAVPMRTEEVEIEHACRAVHNMERILKMWREEGFEEEYVTEINLIKLAIRRRQQIYRRIKRRDEIRKELDSGTLTPEEYKKQHDEDQKLLDEIVARCFRIGNIFRELQQAHWVVYDEQFTT